MNDAKGNWMDPTTEDGIRHDAERETAERRQASLVPVPGDEDSEADEA